MSVGGRSGLWDAEPVVGTAQEKVHTQEDVMELWSGLYDLLIASKDLKIKAGERLRQTLIKAYDLAQVGQVEESVRSCGPAIKALLIHLNLLPAVFGPDDEMGGQTLAILAEYTVAETVLAPSQEGLFEGVFA